MKILYFSFVELDIPNACQTHTLGVLSGFSKNGCHVDALVPRPINVTPRISGVRFHYLWPWQFTSIGHAWIKLLSGMLMFLLCLKDNYDFIYVREMEVNPGPRLISKIFKVPLYIEINDLMVPYFSEAGFHAGFVARVARHQKSDFLQAAGLIVPSAPMRRWLINQYGLPPDKVHLVLNGTALPAGPPLSRMEARKKLGMPSDCFCLGFLGNIYERYDFDTLLQAAHACRSKIPGLFLLIIGDGPMKNRLEQMVIDLGFESQTIFTGYIESNKLGCYLPAMDAGLLILNDKIARRYGPLTTKSSTYGIYALAVIASSIVPTEYPEELEKAMFLTKPEDAVHLKEIILHLYDNPVERRKRAKAFHDIVRSRMTWNAVAEEVIRIASGNKKMG